MIATPHSCSSKTKTWKSQRIERTLVCQVNITPDSSSKVFFHSAVQSHVALCRTKAPIQLEKPSIILPGRRPSPSSLQSHCLPSWIHRCCWSSFLVQSGPVTSQVPFKPKLGESLELFSKVLPLDNKPFLRLKPDHGGSNTNTWVIGCVGYLQFHHSDTRKQYKK